MISINNILRKGYTTGTTASAAAKGATLYLLTRKVPEAINTLLPDGRYIQVPLIFENGMVGAIKNSGDDPDVTNGLKIFAKVKRVSNEGDTVLKGGKGVGYATKPGLQIDVGQPAINPVPRAMIIKNVREVIKRWGLEIEILIPEGEKVAKKTFNERVGVMGGLSILGTTGIVDPMSLEALKSTIKCEVDVAAAAGFKKIALAPGKIGEDALKKVLPYRIPIIRMSNFAGFALDYTSKKKIEEVIIGGHPGKLAKIAMGYLDTHSSKSPKATTYVAGLLEMKGDYNTVEDLISLVPEPERYEKFSLLASKIAEKICEFFKFIQVIVFLFDMKKKLIGKCGL